MKRLLFVITFLTSCTTLYTSQDARDSQLLRMFDDMKVSTSDKERISREQDIVQKITELTENNHTFKDDIAKKLLTRAIELKSLLAFKALIDKTLQTPLLKSFKNKYQNEAIPIIKPNLVLEDGRTPLVAIVEDFEEPVAFVHYLVSLNKDKEKKADIAVNSTNKSGETALEIVAKKIKETRTSLYRQKLLPVITLLLEAGADEALLSLYVNNPESKQYDQDIANYYYAFASEQQGGGLRKEKIRTDKFLDTLFKELQKKFQAFNDATDQEVLKKLEQEIIEAIEKFVAHGGHFGARTNEELAYLLFIAQNSLPIYKALLEKGHIDPNADYGAEYETKEPLLYSAIDSGKFEIIKYLANRADIDIKNPPSRLLTRLATSVKHHSRNPDKRSVFLNLITQCVAKGAQTDSIQNYITPNSDAYIAAVAQAVEEGLKQKGS